MPGLRRERSRAGPVAPEGDDVTDLSAATAGVADPATMTALFVGAVVALLIGALAGTAVYAATVLRHENLRIRRLVERLGNGPDAGDRAEIERIADPRLRDVFGRLAGQVEDAWTLATTDQLTRIPNRQALLARLNGEIERATRYDRQLSVILIDIDHFKRVNDSFGHAAGDRVLHHVAQGLARSVRAADSVGRYGGEEFMVVLPETGADAAGAIAEKLRRLVGREVVELEDGNRAQVSLSAGVAGGIGRNLRLDDLIRDADAALYSAKALGRDQVYLFREVEDDRLVKRAAIAPSARERAVVIGRAAMGAATRSLTDVLAERPGWAGGPSTLIAEAAAEMATSLGLPSSEVERIRTASLLHDLGKVAIPDQILSKDGGLDEPEWRVVSEHPKIGQVVLEQAGALRDAATIVLHHHEWFDGRGYPHGLKGQEIPIGARIVAVADAYEAMVAGRPYRDAISHRAAIAELERNAGIQFDPEVVSLFVLLFEAGVPWPASSHDPDHAHPHAHDAREDTHGGIPAHPSPPGGGNGGGHRNEPHRRRRRVRVVAAADGGPAIGLVQTGTEG